MKLFPDCKIHRMPQRSDEWFDIRKGKLTGTGMGSWLAERPECRLSVAALREMLEIATEVKPPAKLKRDELLAECRELKLDLPETLLKGTFDARLTALAKLVGSLSACEVPDQFEVDPEGPPPRNLALFAIWNGIRLEPEALERFQQDTGQEVEEVGFCEHHSGFSGVSPDALIVGLNEGVELKCPLPETHAKYLLDNNKLVDAYRDQIQGSLAVTGADAWTIQSYSPGSIKEIVRVRVERDEYTERVERGLIEFADYAKREIAELLK